MRQDRLSREELGAELARMKAKAVTAVRERDDRISEIQRAMCSQQEALEASLLQTRHLEQVFDEMQRKVSMARK